MKDSSGKAFARRYFYRTFLPAVLSETYRQAGYYLVLLGEQPRELEHTDALGVPRDHIVSVERVRSIYHRQVEQRLGVSLYYGEMEEYLRHVLHTNHAFAVLNLDVEGGYRTQLDPAMNSALLFTWRNPETVIATYSSIGRDAVTLVEGIKSLATFLWLVPTDVQRFMQDYAARYLAAGFRDGLRLVLRDLFWIRSHLEHLALTGVIVGATKRQAVHRFLTAQETLWSTIIGQRTRSLSLVRLSDLVRATSIHASLKQGLPRMGVSFVSMEQLVYRAHPPWSQRCYFAKFATAEPPMSLEQWLINTFERFRSTPLIAIDRAGRPRAIDRASAPRPALQPIPARDILWLGGRLSDVPTRQVSLDSYPRGIAAIVRTIRMVQRRNVRRPGPPVTACGKEEVTMMRTTLTRNGQLTDAGQELARKLARRGLGVDEILQHIPKAPRLSVRAYVAVAHRHASGQQFMRHGKLTLFGREQIRTLARTRSVDEIAELVPKSVSIRTIRSFVASARKH